MIPDRTEIRNDVLTGRQVLIAETRSARPIRSVMITKTNSPDDDPFLEERESETPNESLALRREDSRQNEPGWLTRVVPNRYPAVSNDGQMMSLPQNEKLNRISATGMPTNGVHEVVIECPDFRTSLTELSVAEFARVLSAWQLRISRIAEQNKHVTDLCINFFRNEGGGAGASLPHCHSQILATAFVPQQIRQRIECAAAARRQSDADLYANWLATEIADGRRVLTDDQQLTVTCPFASRVNFHCRVSPKPDAVLDFCQLTELQLMKVSSRVLSVVNALTKILGPFSHNLLLHLPPVRLFGKLPWMLDLLPRKSRLAGFEIMTDMDIVTVAPERAAQQLRDYVEWLPLANGDEQLCPAGYSWKSQ